MQRGETLIYSARLQADGLLGDPDLLRREGDGYIAGDIKSGAGEEVWLPKTPSALPFRVSRYRSAWLSGVLQTAGLDDDGVGLVLQ